MPDNMLAAQIQPPVGVGPTMQSLTTISNMNSEMRLRGVQTQAAQLAYGVQKSGYDLIAQGVPAEDAWMRVGDPTAIHTMAQAKLAATQEQAVHLKYVQDNMGKLVQGYDQMVQAGQDPTKAGDQILSSAVSMGFITQDQYKQVQGNPAMQKQLIAWARGASLEPGEYNQPVVSPSGVFTTPGLFMQGAGEPAAGGVSGGGAPVGAPPAPPAPNTLAAASQGAPGAAVAAPAPNTLAAASQGTLGAPAASGAATPPPSAGNAPAGSPEAPSAPQPQPGAATAAPLPPPVGAGPPAVAPSLPPGIPLGAETSPFSAPGSGTPAPGFSTQTAGAPAAGATPPPQNPGIPSGSVVPIHADVIQRATADGRAAEAANPAPRPTARNPNLGQGFFDQSVAKDKSAAVLGENGLNSKMTTQLQNAVQGQRDILLLRSDLASLNAALNKGGDSTKLAEAWLTTGPGQNTRAQLAKVLNQGFTILGRQPLFSTDAISKAESADKLTTGLGFTLARMLGSREAMQVVQQAVSINPGSQLTPQGNRLVLSATMATAEQLADEANYALAFSRATPYNGIDAQQHYNQAYPPEDYAMGALLRAAPPGNPSAALEHLLQTPSAVSQFDELYGAGVGEWALKHPDMARSAAAHQF